MRYYVSSEVSQQKPNELRSNFGALKHLCIGTYSLSKQWRLKQSMVKMQHRAIMLMFYGIFDVRIDYKTVMVYRKI